MREGSSDELGSRDQANRMGRSRERTHAIDIERLASRIPARDQNVGPRDVAERAPVTGDKISDATTVVELSVSGDGDHRSSTVIDANLACICNTRSMELAICNRTSARLRCHLDAAEPAIQRLRIQKSPEI
jgi:hypothetical protein